MFAASCNSLVVLPSPCLFKTLSATVELFLSIALTDELANIAIQAVGSYTSRLRIEEATSDCKSLLRDTDELAHEDTEEVRFLRTAIRFAIFSTLSLIASLITHFLCCLGKM